MTRLIAEEGQFILPLARLIAFTDTQIPAGAFVMRSLQREHVQHLTASDPARWPALLVTRCTEGYLIIDGYHRREAATLLKLDRLPVLCRTFADEHAVIEAAFRANLTHGLTASMATRGDYAYWLHLTYPALTQEQIARRAQMTQSAVSKALIKREQETRRALRDDDQEIVVDLPTQRKRARQALRRFTREATHFLGEVAILSDAELASLLTSDERVKLARLLRLLVPAQAATGTTEPQRLPQLTQPGHSGGSHA